MPTPEPNESKDDYMKRCVPMVMNENEGMKQEQAVAVCSSKFEQASASPPQNASALMQQYAVFSEPIQISEDVSCCLKVNAVIAKEGIYTFPAGANGENKQCLWSRTELLKATRTARAAKITIKEHPPGKVVTSQDEIYGTVEKPFFDRDRIRATLSFDKDITPVDFLEGIRAAASKEGTPKDVSIGFYYSEDPTPGEWHGQHYDLAMRNIVIDHVATGVWKGRCTYPNCGIGVSSEEMKQFAAASMKKKEEATQVAVPPTVEPPKTSPSPPTTPPATQVTPPSPTPPTTPPPASPPKQTPPKTSPLTTQQLIEQNQTLLQMKQKRDEQNRIEQLRHQRRNPLS
jgi:hypothetical protein